MKYYLVGPVVIKDCGTSSMRGFWPNGNSKAMSIFDLISLEFVYGNKKTVDAKWLRLRGYK